MDLVIPWIVIPILIFCARILDVSIGTMRVIFIARGYRWLAPILGFVEVVIWLLAIQQIMQNLTNVWCFFAYAAGFATGTYVGMIIEEKLSLGDVLIRIITKKDAELLIASLRAHDYTVTSIDGEGNIGAVKVIFSIIPRQHISYVVKIIQEHNPLAFYTIEDIRSVHDAQKKQH